MARLEVPLFDRLSVTYDRGMAPLESLWLRRMRGQLLSHAGSAVLEIGVGTGANLPFFSSVCSLTAVDESADMLSITARRADALGRSLNLSQINAEHLAFASGHFDTVIASLVLCSVVDPEVVLGELRRVLRKPGGQLLLLEHMRPNSRLLAWLVDRLNGPWCAMNGRCHLNRETQKAVVTAGFVIDRLETRLGGLLRLIVAHTP